MKYLILIHGNPASRAAWAVAIAARVPDARLGEVERSRCGPSTT